LILAHLFKIGKYTVLTKIQTMKKPDVRTEGATSRIPTTALHVTFLDYDNVTDERLKEELSHLQDEFEIGNFYVLKTKNDGRHCVCIDALTFKDQKQIVDFSSCDLLFKKAPRINEYRCWVLRYAKKGTREEPKYLYTVESPYEGKNPQSRGHAKYLLNFGIKIDLKNPFGPEAIETQEYNTRNKTEDLEENANDPVQET
jgi:hypothetical protein